MGWASSHIPHHLLESLNPVHETNPLNPTDYGTIHLLNKKKKDLEGKVLRAGHDWKQSAFPHCLWWWFKDVNWPSAQWWLNQRFTGGKEFPLLSLVLQPQIWFGFGFFHPWSLCVQHSSLLPARPWFGFGLVFTAGQLFMGFRDINNPDCTDRNGTTALHRAWGCVFSICQDSLGLVWSFNQDMCLVYGI